MAKVIDFVKRYKVYVAGAAVVLVLALGAFYFLTPKGSENNLQIAGPETSVTEDSSSEEEVAESGEVKSAQEQAQATLENSDQETTVSDDLKNAVAAMTGYVSKSSESSPKPSAQYQCSLTSEYMMYMLKEAYNYGYTYSDTTLKAYKSNEDNVTQFTFDMTKGDNTVVFTGNFVPGTKQLQVSVMKGSLYELGS